MGGRYLSRIPVLLRIAVAALALAAGPAPGREPPRLVVDSKPVHALIAGLMQGVGEPRLLFEAADPPWRQRLTRAQDRALQQADLLIWTGPEFTPQIGDWLTGATRPPRTLELLADDALKILPTRGEADRRDPFFWTDSRNMLILLRRLTGILIDLDPERDHRYRENQRALQTELAQLDRQLEYGYREVSATPVFLFHDTQQYFEQAYAMKTAGIAASPAGAPVPTTALLELRRRLAQAPSACLFTEAGLPSPHLELLASAKGVRVVELDTLGSRLPPGPGLYTALMRGNFEAIRDCLQPSTLAPTADAAGPQPATPRQRIQSRYLLMNHFGETVTNLDFAGHYQLIYFGYTFCPDICPTSLATMSKALELLGADADRIQPLFITVDPARDTLPRLREYVGYFHPRLLGLTGPETMIARVAGNFRVRYEKVASTDSRPDRYAVDHTASLFLLGPDGRFITKFAHGFPADRMAERLSELMQQ